MRDWKRHFTPLWSLENANNILEKYLEDYNFKFIKFHDIKNEKFTLRELHKLYLKIKFLQVFESVNIKGSDKHELYVTPLKVMYFIAEKQ